MKLTFGAHVLRAKERAAHELSLRQGDVDVKRETMILARHVGCRPLELATFGTKGEREKQSRVGTKLVMHQSCIMVTKLGGDA
jgi:hypothetical protein